MKHTCGTWRRWVNIAMRWPTLPHIYDRLFGAKPLHEAKLASFSNRTPHRNTFRGNFQKKKEQNTFSLKNAFQNTACKGRPFFVLIVSTRCLKPNLKLLLSRVRYSRFMWNVSDTDLYNTASRFNLGIEDTNQCPHLSANQLYAREYAQIHRKTLESFVSFWNGVRNRLDVKCKTQF